MSFWHGLMRVLKAHNYYGFGCCFKDLQLHWFGVLLMTTETDTQAVTLQKQTSIDSLGRGKATRLTLQARRRQGCEMLHVTPCTVQARPGQAERFSLLRSTSVLAFKCQMVMSELAPFGWPRGKFHDGLADSQLGVTMGPPTAYFFNRLQVRRFLGDRSFTSTRTI